MLRYGLFLCAAMALVAQTPNGVRITASPTNPKAHETVVLQVFGVDQGPGQRIIWKKQAGDGSFVSNVGNRVEFQPTTPGDVVKIICQLLGARNEYVQAPELTVSQETPPSSVTRVAGPVAAQAVQPTPKLPQLQETLPAAPDVPIAAIPDDPSKELVVPSGFMGDAEPRFGHGASRLTGGIDCKFESGGCYSIIYDMSRKDLEKGFAGYAWQVLPQEKDMNFGEFGGVDLSSFGFRSLRVYARAASASAITSPKVEFKSGGNIDPKYADRHRHNYIVSTGPQSLSTDWKLFCLDLSRADLRDVVSPLTVVVSSTLNPPLKLELSVDGASFSKDSCPRR